MFLFHRSMPVAVDQKNLRKQMVVEKKPSLAVIISSVAPYAQQAIFHCCCQHCWCSSFWLAVLLSAEMGSVGSALGRHGVEKPSFVVLGNIAGLQCRQYKPCWVAQVSSEGFSATSEKDFMRMAFRILADYIGVYGAPQNSAVNGVESESIAMTAPVVLNGPETINMTAPVVVAKPAAVQTMAFFLPSNYSDLQEPPKPLDKRVKIRQIPSHVVIVSTFSGESSPQLAKDHAASCISRIQEAAPGVEFLKDDTGSTKWEFFAYDPPYTLPPFRTNEVAVYVQNLPNLSSQE